MILLKFNLTAEEYFDYTFYTTWSSPDKKPYRVRYYLRVFLLYTLIAGLYIFINHTERILVDLVIFSTIALIYFIIVPALIKGSIKRRVNDVLARPENEHILDESVIILSDTGIIDSDKVSETKYDWEAIVKKVETPNVYYLYTNSYHAVVIPKRTLKTAEDRQELHRLFNQHLPLGSEFAT